MREALAVAVGGRPVAPVADGPYTIDAVVMVPPEYRNTPEGIGSITVPSASGAPAAARRGHALLAIAARRGRTAALSPGTVK